MPCRRPKIPGLPLIPALPHLPAAGRRAMLARCRERATLGWPGTLLIVLAPQAGIVAIMLLRLSPGLSASAYGTWLASCISLHALLLARLMRPLIDEELRARGHCMACGYDVRATPDPGGPRLARCPECGTDTGHPAVPQSTHTAR